jgi:hypothetical protein
MKSKPIHGLIVLAATFFFAFAPTCGVVGTLLHRAAVFLVGQTGSTLIACTAFVIGVLLIVPVPAWVRLFRWGFRADVKQVERIERAERATDAPVAKIIPIRPSVPPMLPAVKDARGGLKYLGYSNEEIDSAMDRIEQRGTADEMIRAALKLLRKAV